LKVATGAEAETTVLGVLSHGHVGRFFGPVMVFWFGLLAVAGLAHILAFPAVLRALDPRYALAYLPPHDLPRSGEKADRGRAPAA
jgi:K+ transporter